jgi:hypothetical protein
VSVQLSHAFLVGGDKFGPAFAHIRAQGLPYWADPGQHRPYGSGG